MAQSAEMATREAPAPVRIRRAALRLFAAQGFYATGIREIAEAAGIPTSLLYHYRRSKEEILHDLVVEGVSRHLESSRRALDLTRTPEEALRAMVAVHVLVPVRNPDMARIMESEVRALSPASQETVLAMRRQGDARWEEVLRAGIAESVFTIPDVVLARRLLRRMCTGVTLWFTPAAEAEIENVVTGMTDHALGLVRAVRDGKLVRATAVTHPPLSELQEIVESVHREPDFNGVANRAMTSGPGGRSSP